MTIRVAIIEDQAMLRSAIVVLLNLESDITVVSELDGGDDAALKTVIEERPEVVLLDVEMSGRSGLDIAEFLRGQQDRR